MYPSTIPPRVTTPVRLWVPWRENASSGSSLSTRDHCLRPTSKSVRASSSDCSSWKSRSTYAVSSAYSSGGLSSVSDSLHPIDGDFVAVGEMDDQFLN